MAYSSLRRRIIASCSILSLLVSCSSEGLVPPGEIDGRTRVGSISPSRPVASGQGRQNGYNGGGQPVSEAMQEVPEENYLREPDQGPDVVDRGPVSEPLSHGGQMSQAFPPAVSSSIPSDGVNMDAELGVAPVVGLAAAQQMEIAEGEAAQPVVDGIGTDSPALRAPQMPSGPREQMQSSMRSAQPSQEVAMIVPRNPTIQSQPTFREQPRETPGMRTVMPSSEASCRTELRRLGVSFRDVAAIANGPSCGIDYPIELSGLSGGVAIKPAVKLNCQVTLAFAKWVKYELVPSSRFRYMSGVGRITPMGGYSCRKMNSRARNPWSEHARGNAIDIGTITLKNGKEIDVRKKGFFAFREKGLLKAVRTDSCKYFSTVLGPGSDPDHWNHFHFDLRTRKTGYRHCD